MENLSIFTKAMVQVKNATLSGTLAFQILFQENESTSLG